MVKVVLARSHDPHIKALALPEFLQYLIEALRKPIIDHLGSRPLR